MKVIIIEDEILAQAKLEAMLRSIDPEIEIVAKLGSVKESRAWLEKHPAPDVAFVDIQLSDDHSFEIFKNFHIQFPVIFTTAFDKYLLESFEHNTIDYLLKPITEDKLRRSLTKLKNLELHFFQGNLGKALAHTGQGNNRMVVKKGTEYIALKWQDVAYFFTEHKVVFVKDIHGRQFIIDKTLGELESELNDNIFFRLNRKFIAHESAIEKFKPDNGKIRVFLRPALAEEVHISKETAPLFRQWISGKH
jgi:DNA-binding LytR/AlgR family response regulator